MLHLSATQLADLLDFPCLMAHLRHQLATDQVQTPPRAHHSLPTPGQSYADQLLLMPAWQTSGYMGVKILSVVAANSSRWLPTIQGTYLLFDRITGQPICTLEAASLTNLRTAAMAALAADLLARPEASTLLIIGTGSLSPYLIAAHRSIRAFDQILLWGRDATKATAVALQAKDSGGSVVVASDLVRAISQADVICAATAAEQPLIATRYTKPGQHIGLLGSYRPHMIEAEATLISQSKLYVDNVHALDESGDLIGPLQQGLIDTRHLRGTINDLCAGRVAGRTDACEITVYKSVGHAEQDLIAASLAYERSR